MRLPFKVFRLVALLHVASTVYAEEKPLVVYSFPIVPYVDSELPQGGVASTVVKRAFAAANVDATVQITSINRAKEEAQNAPVFLFVRNPQREAKWHFSEPIFVSQTLLVVHTNNPIKWRSFSDLLEYGLGITRGYSYGPEFERFRTRLNMDVSSSDEINLTKLIGQRIDAFPIERHVLGHLLKSMPVSEYAQLQVSDGPDFAAEGTHVVCAKSAPKCVGWLAAFDRGIGQLKKSGEYQRIMARLGDRDPFKLLGKPNLADDKATETR